MRTCQTQFMACNLLRAAGSAISGEIYFPICCMLGTDALGDKLSICLWQISRRITTCFDATATDCALSPGMR